MDKELRGQMQSAQIPESKAEEAGGCCCRTKSRTELEQRVKFWKRHYLFLPSSYLKITVVIIFLLYYIY